MQFFRSKIAISISGVVIIGIATTAFVLLTAATAPKTASIAVSVTATSSPSGDVTATPIPDGSTPSPGGNGPTPTPTKIGGTATPTSRATPTTPPITGQQIDWMDTVRSVGSSSFMLRTHTATVVVNTQTIYSGSAHSLGQMRGGMRVEVHGVVQANGDVLATEVNAQGGDN